MATTAGDCTMQPNESLLRSQKKTLVEEVHDLENELKSLHRDTRDKKHELETRKKQLAVARDRKLQMEKMAKRQDVKDQLAKLNKIGNKRKKLAALKSREAELAAETKQTLDKVHQIEREYFKQIEKHGPKSPV